MDIAYVTVADLASKSGAVDHVLGISQGLAELGNTVHLIAGASSRDFSSTSTNLIHHSVPIAGLSPPKAVAKVAKHALNVIQQRDIEIVYLRTFPIDYILFTRHLIQMKVPYACELNTITDAEYRAKGQTLKGIIYRFWEGRTLAKSLGWLPVTQEIRAWAERISRTQKPFLIAANGVAIDTAIVKKSRKEVRQMLGVPDSLPVLIMAGFSRPWHGVERALALLAGLPAPVELWLLGAQRETDRRYIENMAPKYGVDGAVRVFPWLNKSNTADLVAAADVGIGSLALDRNHMTEAQPLKVRFYLALGLPVLINYRDPRLLNDNLPFVSYVPSNEPKALASGVEKLLHLSLDERRRIRAYAVENLSWKAIASETEAFLDRLLMRGVYA